MIQEMENARHSDERGEILRQLLKAYANEMTSVRSLARAMFMVGREVSAPDMQFHLCLLADSEYVKIWRAKDTPGWRPDRMNETKGDTIVFARLTPRGVALIDGKIAADPNVSF